MQLIEMSVGNIARYYQLGSGRPKIWKVGYSSQDKLGRWTHEWWHIDATGVPAYLHYSNDELGAISALYHGRRVRPSLWRRLIDRLWRRGR